MVVHSTTIFLCWVKCEKSSTHKKNQKCGQTDMSKKYIFGDPHRDLFQVMLTSPRLVVLVSFVLAAPVAGMSLRPYTMRRGGSNMNQIVSSPSSIEQADEKAVKLRERDQNRCMQIVLFLGILSLVFVVIVVKLHHTPNKRSIRHGYNKATTMVMKRTTIIGGDNEAVTNSSV
jgi:hypothetical protein